MSDSELVSSSAPIASRIADALKLDLKYIKRINLNLDVDSIVFCTVEFYPTLLQLESVAEALETEMSQYALVKLQQTKSID